MIRTLCAVSLALSMLVGCGRFPASPPTAASSGHPPPGIVTGSEAAAAIADQEAPATP